MRFDSAFMCKSGVVGMQFVVPALKGAIISVFHDGKGLQVSEQFSNKFKQEALKKYFQLLKWYKPRNRAVLRLVK